MKIRPVVKSHGGKYYLSSWIIQNFPVGYQKMTYCEPFCAGASVFLNKEQYTPDPDSEEENVKPEEVISDMDQGVIYIFKALRDEPKEFISRIKRTRYTERTFKMALNKAENGFDDYIDHAVTEYVLRRMSRGGLKTAFAWSDRLRGGKPGDLNAWETMAKQLPCIAERVKDTIILCQDFKEVAKVWDEEDTLTYLDPPYLHSTRSDTEVYEHELSVEDHIQLLNTIKAARGKVIISGYSSPLYNRVLKDWKIKRKNVANHSSQKKKKERRVEVLWMNYG